MQSEVASFGAAASRAIGKVRRRILPFVFVLYMIAYLDRANVAFAKVAMSADLGFSEAVYGFGAGLFFIGYFLLEIPGALIVERYGARRWMARILITWGLCTVLVGLVRTAHQFYAARFILGAAEAGFYPGIIVYLSHWFPYRYRARAMAGFVLAIPLSLALGSPVSGMILHLHWFGLAGWRWVFILEGLPAIVFGFITLGYLTDSPEHAKWLLPDERAWISEQLKHEKESKAAAEVSIWQAMRMRNVLLLAGTLCLANTGVVGYLFWLPATIQKASALPVFPASLLSALPFVLAMVVIFLAGRSSDRSGERRLHTVLPLFLSGCLFALTAIPKQPFASLLLWLCLTGGALYGWTPSFWVLPTLVLKESAAAAAIGLINAVGNLGGFIGPAIVGYVLTKWDSFPVAVLFLSACFIAAGFLVFTLRGIQPADQARSNVISR